VNLIQDKIEKIAKRIGIVEKEAFFILDIEAIFAMKKPAYELDLKIYDLYKELGDSWLTIKNEHIESLNFNFFNWFLLKENTHIYDSLNQLRFPEVYLNLLNDLTLPRNEVLHIPPSIGNLSLLKNLNLSHNYIQEIPKSIEMLKSLTVLNLSWNSFQNIPESIFSLSCLKKLDLSHNNIREVPEKITILKSLNELNLDNNIIGNLSDSLRGFFDTLEKFSY
jgi:Leucine-rich repeat (LRR) protein